MTTKTFECLRCESRFPMDHEPGKVVERTCPRCGSNSVRMPTARKKEAAPEREVAR